MVVVTPAGTHPGSLEWMRSAAGLAKSWSHRSERDVRELVKYLDNLREHDWSILIDGEKDWDRLCREVIGQESGFLAEMEEGIRILERRGHSGPVSEKQAREAVAEKAKESKPPADTGRPKKGVVTTPLPKGMHSDRIAARIARDRPDILERMKQGDFKSVRSAAIEAGIIKPDSPLKLLKRAWNKASEKERKEFQEWCGS